MSLPLSELEDAPVADSSEAIPTVEEATAPIESVRFQNGELIRTIRRRSGDLVNSTAGFSDSEPFDALSLADRLFLRSDHRPDYCQGESELRVADLFSGCGAMSLGIAEACRALGIRFTPALACDLEQVALDVYGANFQVPVPKPRDLNGLSSLLEASLTPFEIGLVKASGRIDLVIGGPPCQGHSNLNNYTRREDPKNALYFKMARFAKLFEPRFIVVENVMSVLKDRGQVVQRTMEALTGLGYSVAEGLVDMPLIGVAQTRKRHILLAVHESVGFEAPAVKSVVANHRVKPRDVCWAIDDLDLPATSDSLLDGMRQMNDDTIRRIDWLFDNNEHDLPDDERPDCHRTKAHTYQSVYGRMWWDRPGPTITSGFNTMGQGRFVHPHQRRTITPHEAARLQFIPDFFDFSMVKHRNALTSLIGNAVPPKLSYVLALELLR